MNWRICIDSPQKRALDLCSGTMNKGRGSGYDWNYGSGSGVRPARGFGDGVGSGTGFGDGVGSGSGYGHPRAGGSWARGGGGAQEPGDYEFWNGDGESKTSWY